MSSAPDQMSDDEMRGLREVIAQAVVERRLKGEVVAYDVADVAVAAIREKLAANDIKWATHAAALAEQVEALEVQLGAHRRPVAAVADEIIDACAKAWNANIPDHAGESTCPTWYDGCHCRSDKRVDEAIRALKGRFDLVPSELSDDEREKLGEQFSELGICCSADRDYAIRKMDEAFRAVWAAR